MKYELLCNLYETLENSSKRLEKTYHISNFLKKTKEEDLEKIILLLRGRVFPEFDQTELGISKKLLLKSLSLTTGLSPTKIEEKWKNIGDIGLVFEKLSSTKNQQVLFKKELEVKDVFETIKKIATKEGIGSTENKIKLLTSLLADASSKEAKYIVRTILKDLRIGVAEGTLRDSILWAFLTNPNYNEEDNSINPNREEYNELIDIIQNTINKTNDFTLVAHLATKGIDSLKKVKITYFKPIKVMLAQRSKDLDDAVSQSDLPVACEYKSDGFRLQIHKKEDEVKLFTRRLEDVTKQFPDVQEIVKSNVKAKNCVLDSEAVGFDKTTLKYLPFQSISQRIKRKHNIESLSKNFPVELLVFDVLMLDEEEKIEEPFQNRRNLLEKIILKKDKKISCMDQIIANKKTEIKKFFEEAIQKGHEGLMLKKPESTYKPGSRVGNMIKLKPHMDELDLVITKAEWGTGKRSGWMTSFTVACKLDEEFLEIGKVGTGLKEKKEEGFSFEELTNLLKPHLIKETGREATFNPKIIISVRFEEIQKSPSYASGYALRFPRIISLRDEKPLDDVTSLQEIELMFMSQRTS